MADGGGLGGDAGAAGGGALWPWARGALGSGGLVARVLARAERMGDVQTAATIVCVLASSADGAALLPRDRGFDRLLWAYGEVRGGGAAGRPPTGVREGVASSGPVCRTARRMSGSMADT